MDTRLMFEIAAQIVVVAAIIAALKTTVAFVVTRLEKIEAKLDKLPSDYVPRAEMDRALGSLRDEMKAGLDGLRTHTTQILDILKAYMAGKAQPWPGTLQAAAAEAAAQPIATVTLSGGTLVRFVGDFFVIYAPIGEEWCAYVSGVSGICVSADTLEDADRVIRERIQAYLDELLERHRLEPAA